MSVKKEASGRRSVQVEVEVPGTPEEVWQAIASGPGISSWFVPAEFEERDGKPVAVKLNFGPGMESRSALTAWTRPGSLPRRARAGWFAAYRGRVDRRSVRGWRVPVRVVHSLFASTDDWDNQLEGTESGWPGFFRTLRIYLTHFRGQSLRDHAVRDPRRGNRSGGLGNADRGTGTEARQRRAASDRARGRPALSGVVEHATQSPCNALLRLDKPGPGTAALVPSTAAARSWWRSVSTSMAIRPEPSPARRRGGKRGSRNASRCPGRAEQERMTAPLVEVP